ncbi:MAG: lamin tail domain-containing protein [Bacteroidales bacterium]|nr:lamin tail domain-containing protein [Bacteroidales bacterium]
MNKVILLTVAIPLQVSGQVIDYPGSPNRDAVVSTGDVVITEIMADPTPSVALPVKEYLELHNRTGDTVSLKGWRLSDGNSNSLFPEVSIVPGGWLIVCQAQDTALFARYGNTAGLKSFPALTNEGKTILIMDAYLNLIHGIKYSSDWYGDVLKSGGGWSLEMVDPAYPFHEKGNWKASVSPDGGTPGTRNSVEGNNPDPGFYGIENVFPADSVTITLRFSESIPDFPDKSGSISIDGVNISTIVNEDPLFRSFTVIPEEPLEFRKVYTLTAGSDVTDFAGNRMSEAEFRFGLPEQCRNNDVLFNELLFNPLPGDPDFIEFYNCSEKIINTCDLFLVSVKDETGDTSSVVPASSENHCLLPRYNIVITCSKDILEERFSSSVPENILEVSSLPSMPDGEGHLILFNRSLEKIDEVIYDEEMHFPLLSGNDGISLEKVNPCAASTDKSQWHSASESSGWGTPGAPNSVAAEDPGNGEPVIFSSSLITPDNDGSEDLLVIDLNQGDRESVVSVTIFEEAGRFVRRLADNLLTGPGASVIWDGTGADGRLLDTGIYIFLITSFDETGKTGRWKKVCTVIR